MTEDADVLDRRAKLYRSYGAIIQIDEAAKKITIDPNEPDHFNWLHAQRQVTIRGFICRQPEEKFVLEIIRLVEQEEPRLGTVYKVNITEKGQLRAALYGPHESGQASADGVFLTLRSQEKGLLCTLYGEKDEQGRKSRFKLDWSSGLPQDFPQRLKTARDLRAQGIQKKGL